MVSLPDLVLPKIQYFGLSIDRTSLRAIELDTKGRIKSSAEVVFAHEIFEGSILTKPDEFVNALRQLIQTGHFSSAYAVVCFPEAFAYSRTLMLPHIAKEDLHEAVSWRIKELFPFPQEEIYYDWRIMEKTEDGYHLSVVAVQKKILDPILSSLHSVGVKPLLFEPAGQAIARLLVIPKDKQVLVTEINRNVAYVTLVEGRAALFTTLINYRKEDTVSTFVAAINATIQEITSFYRQKGVLKDEKQDVVLTGEVVTQDWVPHIVYPAKILQTSAKGPAYNKAFAAAKAVIVPPGDPDTINLLPATVQEYYDQERNTSFYKNMLVRASMLFGALTLVAAVAFVALRAEHQRLDAQVKRLTAFTQSQPSSLQRLLQLNAQASAIVALAPLRVTPRQQIQTIAATVPTGITITQWEYDDSKLEFTLIGIADTRNGLLEFKDALEATGEFANITLPLEFLETPINVAFELKFVRKK